MDLDKRMKDAGDLKVTYDVFSPRRHGRDTTPEFKEVFAPMGRKEDPDRVWEEQAYRSKKIIRNVVIGVLAAAVVGFIIWWVVMNFENVQFNPPSDKIKFW